MSLGSSCLNPETNGRLWREFLRVLGLWVGFYENQRPDRANFISVNYDNLQSAKHDYCALTYQLPEGEKSDFVLLDEYDYYSLMHFPAFDPTRNTQFAKKRTEPIMIPKRDEVEIRRIGQRDRPSRLDIEKLRILYGCGGTGVGNFWRERRISFQ